MSLSNLLMSRTKPIAIILMFVCTLFTSVAQLLYKQGSKTLSLNFLDLITNHALVLGLILYGIGAIIMIYALRHGEVSVLYPIIATSYIWVTLLAGILFNEQISFMRWLGVITIIGGIILIGLGSKHKHTSLYYTEGV